MTNNMNKKITGKMMGLLIAVFTLSFSMTIVSCEDILEVDSDRQIFDPALDSQIDSIYFTLGIMKSLQQCGDQLVLVNELRGDVAGINEFTETPLRELYNLSATESNKYDSAYVFYRVINNCNYYIAHRDTTLHSGSRYVAMAEYVQAKTVRAWTYMQLAKLYGSVPFYTEPVTGLLEANEVKERRDVRGIYDAFVDDLEYYCDSLYAVPYYGNIDVGNVPGMGNKTVDSRKIMLPVELVTADLCLEAGDYARAARHYFGYLLKTKTVAGRYSAVPVGNYGFSDLEQRMEDNNITYISYPARSGDWSRTYRSAGAITYIPFASNRLRGVVTDLPRIFGFNMYEVETTLDELYLKERQIEYSPSYIKLSDSQDYFNTLRGAIDPEDDESGSRIQAVPLGDLRRYNQLTQYMKNDSIYAEITKYNEGNIVLYRPSMVYLRLAEAINRMGYPDAAFMILKDGINRETLVTDSINYKPETTTFYYETIPFLSDQNYQVMTAFNNQQSNVGGIHSYGTGMTSGMRSPYSLSYVIGRKFEELSERTGLVMDSVNCTINDTINAMEDIICDEMALELAFEGHRYTDLCRMARHKNEASPARYGSNFGSIWLRDKLAFKNPVVDLADPQQWYLKAFFNR